MRKKVIFVALGMLVAGTVTTFLIDHLASRHLQRAEGRVSSAEDPSETESAPELVPINLSLPTRLAIGGLGLSNEEQNSALADLVVAELSAEKGFDLVDRQSLEKILREAQLNLSGLVRARDAIRMGGLIKADWFLFGTVVPVNGTNVLIARIVDAPSGIIRDFAVLRQINNPAAAAKDLAQFVRRARHEGGKPHSRNYVAISGFEDLSVNNRYPQLSSELRSFLVSACQDTNVTLLEREAINALWSELRLDLAGMTQRSATNVLNRVQFAFWIVDGFYQSYEAAGLEVDLILRVRRVFGPVSRTVLREKPGEPLFRRASEAMQDSLARKDLSLKLPGRQNEIFEQMQIGRERSRLRESNLTEQNKFTTPRYVPIGAVFPMVSESGPPVTPGGYGNENWTRRRQNLEAAIEAFQTVLLLDPEHAEAKLYLAACLRDPAIGQPDKARSLCREVVGSSTEDFWRQTARKALAFSYCDEDDLKLSELLKEVAVHSKTAKEADLFHQAAGWARARYEKMNSDMEGQFASAEAELVEALEKGLANAKNGGEPMVGLGRFHALAFTQPDAQERIEQLVLRLHTRLPEMAPYLLACAIRPGLETNSPVVKPFLESLKTSRESPDKLLHLQSYIRLLAGEPLRWLSDNWWDDHVIWIDAMQRHLNRDYQPDFERKARLSYAYIGVRKYEEALALLDEFGTKPIRMRSNGPWGNVFNHPFLPGSLAAYTRGQLNAPVPEDAKLFKLGAAVFEWSWPFVFDVEENNIWATDGVVLKEFTLDFQEVSVVKLPIQKQGQATSMCFGSGKIWIGTTGGGLFEFEISSRKFRRLTTQDGLLMNDINCLYYWDQHLWIGFGKVESYSLGQKVYSGKGGLGKMDIQTGNITTLTPPISANQTISRAFLRPGDLPPESSVVAISRGLADELWIASWGVGVQRYRMTSNAWETFPSSDHGNRLSCLIADEKHLFAGCVTGSGTGRVGNQLRMEGGLTLHRDNSGWTFIHATNGLPADSVTALALDQNDLWIGGMGFIGLMDVKSGNFRRLCYVRTMSVERILVTHEYVWVHIGRYLYRIPMTSFARDLAMGAPRLSAALIR